MKKFVITLILGLVFIISFSSCNNFKEARERNNFIADSLARVEFVRDSIAKVPYKITSLIDSLSIYYPNAFENPVQAEKMCLHTFMDIVTNMNYISEIPMTYSRMYKNGSEWICCFESDKYDRKITSFTSNYDSAVKFKFYIHVRTNGDDIENINKESTYYLNGEFDDNTLGFSKVELISNEIWVTLVMKNTKIIEK